MGEMVGEHLYRELARRSLRPEQQSKLNAIADVERLTHQTLKPIAERLQIQPEEAQWRDVVARRVRETASLAWPDFIARAVDAWPPYIDKFESIAAMAPEGDLASMRLLVEHEVALVQFVQAESAAPGSESSINVLHDFLKRGTQR